MEKKLKETNKKIRSYQINNKNKQRNCKDNKNLIKKARDLE